MSEENKDNQLRRSRINITREHVKPNAYAMALDNEFKDYAFNEERAPHNKGLWRKNIFKCADDKPIDVEIGTGTGTHLTKHTQQFRDRLIVGLELKYKPLIQTIRRAQLDGSRNSAMCRFHAFDIDLLFEKNEINNVFVHFPDPWVTPRKPKNRVVNSNILNTIFDLQRPESFLEFKTDSREYFLWSLEQIKKTSYHIEFQTLNLHKEGQKYLQKNFATGFEELFVKKGIEINYIRLVKL